MNELLVIAYLLDRLQRKAWFPYDRLDRLKHTKAIIWKHC